MESSAPQKSIAVVGAGIIGASVAYQLALHGQRVTVFEQCHPACAASGKSAGFLAKDWCDTSPLKHLAHPSFEMHRTYQQSLQQPIHYRRLESYSLSLTNCTAPQLRNARRPPALGWLNGRATVLNGAHQLGSTDTNAQVLPSALTTALLAHAQDAVGTELILSRVTDIKRSPSSSSAPLWQIATQNNQPDLLFDMVILAMGPWTQTARKWFPQLPQVSAHKAASLVIPINNLPATALFTEFITPNHETRTIEAYPRTDELYICQTAIAEPLPEDPSTARADPRDIDSLRDFAKVLNKDLALAASKRHTHRTQACWLPVSQDGLPLIGAVSGTDKSVLVATAHACWGILNSPATGKAIAELVTHGRTISIDIRAFDPSRFESIEGNGHT
ncbi:oxidoreductase TDA3 [Gracilaria domingensis]|nr:oxidoreductase TDA3 [Gracilaria domingensis]